MMELTLGPILFDWRRDEVLRFYDEVADLPIDRVYVGEVVCAKKLGLNLDDVASIIKKLESAGKKVTLSSLAVVSNEDELAFTRRLVGLHGSIEANDMSVLNIVDASVKEVFAGPHITTYNAPSIEFLKSIGVARVTFPVELSRASMASAIKRRGYSAKPSPTANSPFLAVLYVGARLVENQCSHCARCPDGMELKTVTNAGLRRDLSFDADVYTLVEFVEDFGNRRERCVAQKEGTKAITGVFRKRIEEPRRMKVRRKGPRNRFCNGWYSGSAGKDYTRGEN